MQNLIITALFLISAAIAAGSIVIVSQLRAKYHFDFLLYTQVFYFMFGFYALWGQVVISAYLSPLINQQVLNKINEISVLLGSPFIVFGWLMFLKFFNGFLGVKKIKAFDTIFLVLNILFLVAIGIWNSEELNVKTLFVLKYYFVVSTFVYTSYVGIILFTSEKQPLLKQVEKKKLSVGLILFMLSQNITLIYFNTSLWVLLVFIFLFFMGTAFVPVFLRYNLEDVVKPKIITPNISSFDDFCKQYEISPREKDIIHEICNGLTNQQIADKLFISLQTVKDHTHRIYGKTMATSRMQLMKMVREISGN